MGEEEDDFKSQEIIIRKYLKYYIDKKSYDQLRNEIIDKGYNQEIFDKIYKEMRYGGLQKNVIEKIIEVNKTQQEDDLKKVLLSPQYIQIKKEPSFSQNSSPNIVSKQIKGGEFVMVPVKKEELEKVLREKNPSNFFVPSNIMTYAFCIILLLAAGISISRSFSFSSLTGADGGEIGKASFFRVGYPLVFISVSASEDKPFSFYFWYMLVDFLLYLVISYIIDISVRCFLLEIKEGLKEPENKKNI